jgi:hypothetical protein
VKAMLNMATLLTLFLEKYAQKSQEVPEILSYII